MNPTAPGHFARFILSTPLNAILASLTLMPLVAEPSLPAISLIPEAEMGTRRATTCGTILWKADSEWLAKSAPVCRPSGKPMDVSKIHAQAKSMQLQSVWNEIAAQMGDRQDGVFYYEGKPGDHFVASAGGNPRTHSFFFSVSPYDQFDRDADQTPIVKPLPGKEEAVRLSREWMEKLGIKETWLHHRPGSRDLDVSIQIDFETGFDPGTNQRREFDYGMTLGFSQQIGGLAAFANSDGGRLQFRIADGGEFCSIRGTLSDWEKIGDYPVLGKDDIEEALHEGFAWSEGSLDGEVLTITRIELNAFHFRPDHPLQEFPLVYKLVCTISGGRNDGLSTTVHLPALRQHRDLYGRMTDRPAKPEAPRLEID